MTISPNLWVDHERAQEEAIPYDTRNSPGDLETNATCRGSLCRQWLRHHQDGAKLSRPQELGRNSSAGADPREPAPRRTAGRERTHHRGTAT